MTGKREAGAGRHDLLFDSAQLIRRFLPGSLLEPQQADHRIPKRHL